MSNAILKEIIEKINNKGFKVKQTNWGVDNGTSKNKEGVVYITFASDCLNLIASSIIGSAAIAKKPGQPAFNKNKEHIHIDWRAFPENIEHDESYNEFAYYRMRLTAKRVYNEQ